MSEVLILVHLQSATDIPKADLLTQSDPYVKLVCQGRKTKSSTRDNDANPVWNQVLVLPAEVDLERPFGAFEVQIWDKDLKSDELIARTELAIADLLEHKTIEGPFSLATAPGLKSKTAPQLHAKISFQLGYDALKAKAIERSQELIADDKKKRLTFPAPLTNNIGILEIEWEKRGIELKLLLDEKQAEQHCEILSLSKENLVTYRKKFSPPKTLVNQVIAEEIEAEGINYPFDFKALLLRASSKAEISRVTIDDAIDTPNPLSSIDFETLKKVAVATPSAIIEDSKERVFIPVQDGAYLGFAFKTKKLNISLYTTPDCPEDQLYELEGLGKDRSGRVKHYGQPKSIGQLTFNSRISLKGLPLETLKLADLLLTTYKLKCVSELNLNSLFA